MTSAGDQKTYWGLLETVRWICTRDQERVAALWNMSEEDAMASALLAGWPHWYPRWFLGPPETNSDADGAATTPQDSKPRVDQPFMMTPNRALEDLLRKLQSSRLLMTAIRCGGRNHEQAPVPAIELNDLIFRLVPGHPVAPAGPCQLKQPRREIRPRLMVRSPGDLRTGCNHSWCPKRKLDRARPRRHRHRHRRA